MATPKKAAPKKSSTPKKAALKKAAPKKAAPKKAAPKTTPKTAKKLPATKPAPATIPIEPVAETLVVETPVVEPVAAESDASPAVAEQPAAAVETPSAVSPNPASPDAYKQIGERVLRTQGNVYDIAHAILNRDLEDDEWALIKQYGDAVQCEVCSRWHRVAETSKDISDWCQSCVNKDGSSADDAGDGED